jgi:serine/threonine protein kinase
VRVLGRGAFGLVRCVRDKVSPDGSEYALKAMSKPAVKASGGGRGVDKMVRERDAQVKKKKKRSTPPLFFVNQSDSPIITIFLLIVTITTIVPSSSSSPSSPGSLWLSPYGVRPNQYVRRLEKHVHPDAAGAGKRTLRNSVPLRIHTGE